MTGTMSLWGMMQIDGSILDGLQIPQGLDRDTLLDNIILECAELEVLYADAEFFKVAVAVWSAKQVKYWTRVLNAERANYNPIENYDRMEQWTDNASGSKNVSSKSSSSGTAQNSNTTLNQVAGYNSEQLTKAGQSDSGGMTQTNDTATGSGTEERADNLVHTGRVHGNIGTVTAQSMLEQELELAPKIITYNIIIQDFKPRFCLLVY